MSRLVVSLIALSAALAAGAASAEGVTVASPNGRISIVVDNGDKGLTYNVSLDGKAIITPSPLNLNLDIASIGGGAKMLSHKEISNDTTWPIVAGKAATAADHFNQSEIDFQTSDARGFRYAIVVRAYDNGVALRYVVPQQEGATDFKVMNEGTGFNFAGDYDCWGADIGRFDSSFEAEYDSTKASKIRNFQNYMDPLVCKTGVGQTTFAIAESDVKDYPGFYLSGRGDGGIGVQVTLPPRFDNDRNFRFRKSVSAVEHLTGQGFQSPWRVVMIGDTPGDLTASTLIPTLAEPSQIADTSWIKPAKT